MESRVSSRSRDLVQREVERMLAATPSFNGLDPGARRDLSASMAKIAEYLSTGGSDSAVARQMAPDLQQRLAPRNNGAAPAPAPSPATPTPAPASGGATQGGVTGRAGEVARATLNAIDFPSFVASLIRSEERR